MRFILLLTTALMIGADCVAEEKKQPASKAEVKEESEALKKGRARLEECRQLFKEGKQADAIKLAIESIDVLVAPHPPLKGVDIGVIETEKYRVMVYVNTTEDERAKVKKYIVRPYTFYVYPKEAGGKLLFGLDYEHGYSESGVLESAALGRYAGGSHLNYGLIDIKAGFEEVKEAALKLIESDKIQSTEK